MAGHALHLVAVEPRPSVILDMTREPVEPMGVPLADAELDAIDRAPVPLAVFAGMWVAAWARAEHCPLAITDGRLEPHERYEPSTDLWIALSRGMAAMVGALALQLAASRWAFDRGAEQNDPAIIKLGSSLANDSRQNLMAAYEMATREATARRNAGHEPDYDATNATAATRARREAERAALTTKGEAAE